MLLSAERRDLMATTTMPTQVVIDLQPVKALIEDGFAEVGRQFAKVNTRIDALDKRMDAIDTRLDAIDKRLDALEDGQKAIIARVDGLEDSVGDLFDKSVRG